MRTRTILLALSLLIGATTFAGNGEQLFKRKVSSKIFYPEVKGEKVETEVYVQFTVQETGRIVIDSISSTNEEITEKIARQIESIKVGALEKDVLGKTFYYRFLLKVQ